MSEAQLKAGDVVRLKSGGPRMTIEGIGHYSRNSTHDLVKCLWFEGTKKIDGLFEVISLEEAPA